MTELSREALGGAIQRARSGAGLTQGQLGDLTGLGQPLVSRIEAGTRKVDLVELVRVATALDVTLDDLIADAARPSLDVVTSEPTDVAELVALRLADADESVTKALSWVPDFVRQLRYLEQLDADSDDQ
jgi:transcriptional regulator with XRE-family HTH domain